MTLSYCYLMQPRQEDVPETNVSARLAASIHGSKNTISRACFCLQLSTRAVRCCGEFSRCQLLCLASLQQLVHGKPMHILSGAQLHCIMLYIAAWCLMPPT